MYLMQAAWCAHTHKNMAVNQQKMLGASQCDLQYTKAPYSHKLTTGTTSFTVSPTDWNMEEPGVALEVKQLMLIAAISMMRESYW